MKIAVIGMGKIGLPLAVQYARKGHDVIGVDINAATVHSINEGHEPFPEEAHLQEYLIEVIQRKKLKATLSYEEAVPEADVIVVVVPLFVDSIGLPEFKTMDSATEKIGRSLKRGSLVCYETTLPIGTTRNRFTPALEKFSGMKVGQDFSVVFSPERVFTGRIFADLRKYPKIVGGVTQSCTESGKTFYESVLDFDVRPDLEKSNGVWGVQTPESAEFVKLAETTYRDVNIALANQFAMFADSQNINIYEVIENANSQHFSNIHQPGISVGGHCIPVYPQFYMYHDRQAALVEKAREINNLMPNYVVQYLQKKMAIENQKILVYGLSYRKGVKEHHLSGTFSLIRELKKFTNEVYLEDPLYTEIELESLGFQTIKDISRITCIIVHTPHNEFNKKDFKEFKNLNFVYYGRNCEPIDNFPYKILGGSEFKN
jgi:UDP-N-acetyl-D-glucosamine dehydrogenase